MQSTRDIRRRIQSINNTKKITHTMEMIAAVKMRKAIDQVVKMRDYAYYNWQILCNLVHSVQGDADIEINKYIEVRPPKKILFVVVTSNRGLCGSFNAQLIQTVKNKISDFKKAEAEEIDFIGIGGKSKNLLSKLDGKIIEHYPRTTYMPAISDVNKIVDFLITQYKEKKYDRIMIASTDYVNSLVQKAVIYQLLPISIEDWKKDMDMMKKENPDNYDKFCDMQKSLIEPTPADAFQTIFPQLTAARLFHAILESNASKESARMMAMKSASDTASDMVADLTLEYNKLRQAKITQEIAEISAGESATV